MVLAICCLTLSSLLGLVIGVAALGARGRKAQVPFGPALIIATWFCVAMAPEILDPFKLLNSPKCKRCCLAVTLGSGYGIQLCTQMFDL